MYFELIDRTADILARSRQHRTVCDLPLDRIKTEAEAFEIQMAALDSLGFERKGYAITGSSEASRRLLGLTQPVFSEVPASAYYPSGAEILLPPGMIGAQCELAMTMLRSFPDEDETPTRQGAIDAILSYQPAIGLIGRRTQHPYRGDLAAIADFGLHVATIRGAYAELGDNDRLDDIDVNAFLFKRTVVSGSTSCIFDHPADALVWLANRLQRNGQRLQPGDVVTTGSCTTILQVLPDQHLAAEFGPFGQVECFFR
jgi:2-keto-4-pentenoate hydratase